MRILSAGWIFPSSSVYRAFTLSFSIGGLKRADPGKK